jgi:uncharacterized protein (DUF111 family)
MFPTEIRGEMITPTGAGFIAALAKGFRRAARHDGAESGRRSRQEELADRPNLLRVVIGETASVGQPPGEEFHSAQSQPIEAGDAPNASTREGTARESAAPENAGLEWRTMSQIECNIDDMNPELWDFVFARLLEAEALDVWLQPIQMKKNRPASLLGVLCETDRQEALVATILRETTTLGVRISTVRRAAMHA